MLRHGAAERYAAGAPSLGRNDRLLRRYPCAA
jgi:hypothetical protein